MWQWWMIVKLSSGEFKFRKGGVSGLFAWERIFAFQNNKWLSSNNFEQFKKCSFVTSVHRMYVTKRSVYLLYLLRIQTNFSNKCKLKHTSRMRNQFIPSKTHDKERGVSSSEITQQPQLWLWYKLSQKVRYRLSKWNYSPGRFSFTVVFIWRKVLIIQ